MSASKSEKEKKRERLVRTLSLSLIVSAMATDFHQKVKDLQEMSAHWGVNVSQARRLHGSALLSRRLPFVAVVAWALKTADTLIHL